MSVIVAIESKKTDEIQERWVFFSCWVYFYATLYSTLFPDFFSRSLSISINSMASRFELDTLFFPSRTKNSDVAVTASEQNVCGIGGQECLIVQFEWVESFKTSVQCTNLFPDRFSNNSF